MSAPDMAQLQDEKAQLELELEAALAIRKEAILNANRAEAALMSKLREIHNEKERETCNIQPLRAKPSKPRRDKRNSWRRLRQKSQSLAQS